MTSNELHNRLNYMTTDLRAGEEPHLLLGVGQLGGACTDCRDKQSTKFLSLDIINSINFHLEEGGMGGGERKERRGGREGDGGMEGRGWGDGREREREETSERILIERGGNFMNKIISATCTYVRQCYLARLLHSNTLPLDTVFL